MRRVQLPRRGKKVHRFRLRADALVAARLGCLQDAVLRLGSHDSPALIGCAAHGFQSDMSVAVEQRLIEQQAVMRSPSQQVHDVTSG